jgi:hypothetical protein
MVQLQYNGAAASEEQLRALRENLLTLAPEAREGDSEKSPELQFRSLFLQDYREVSNKGCSIRISICTVNNPRSTFRLPD